MRTQTQLTQVLYYVFTENAYCDFGDELVVCAKGLKDLTGLEGLPERIQVTLTEDPSGTLRFDEDEWGDLIVFPSLQPRRYEHIDEETANYLRANGVVPFKRFNIEVKVIPINRDQ